MEVSPGSVLLMDDHSVPLRKENTEKLQKSVNNNCQSKLIVHHQITTNGLKKEMEKNINKMQTTLQISYHSTF